MAILPPVLLLFDSTALLGGCSRDWAEFGQLGECYLPEGVLDAMEFLSSNATERSDESTAKEFLRFYPTQGWKKTTVIGDHATLKVAPGHALSQRARLAIEVLRSAYGLALRYPNSLVILVSQETSVLQKVPPLEKVNLCGLPLTALLQWVRSQRRPQVVSHHLQLMRSASNTPVNSGSAPKRPGGTGPATTRSTAPPAMDWSAPKARRGLWGWRLQLRVWLTNLVSLAVVLVAIAIAWRWISPTSFNQFWNQLPIVGRPK